MERGLRGTAVDLGQRVLEELYGGEDLQHTTKEQWEGAPSSGTHQAQSRPLLTSRGQTQILNVMTNEFQLICFRRASL